MILAGLQTINKDTFYGRNKFSYRQNNIGQSPVSSQLRVHGNALLLDSPGIYWLS